MPKPTLLVCSLIAFLPLQTMAQAADTTPSAPILKRRTISLTTGGATSDITLPVGIPADVQWNARDRV